MSTVDPYLTQMRADAEAEMRDTFAAFAPTVEKVDGFEQDTLAAQGTTRGKMSGRSRDSDTNTRTETVGGVERPVVEGGLHIPLSAPLPAIGWIYQCTAVGALSDLALLGRRWRVVDVPAKSYATARRLDVVEVPE